jgi:hypothetical protein
VQEDYGTVTLLSFVVKPAQRKMSANVVVKVQRRLRSLFSRLRDGTSHLHVSISSHDL